MKFHSSAIATVLALSLGSASAFVPANPNGNLQVGGMNSAVVDDETATATKSLTNDIISKLRFREARQELERRELDASGTLSAMRDRLRHASGYSSAPVLGRSEDGAAIDEEALNKVSYNFPLWQCEYG